MVFDGAAAMNQIVSFMMNGICCAYTKEDEDQKLREQTDHLRKAINVEWQRLKLIELEEERRKKASLLAEERRRQLIATKVMASQQPSIAASSVAESSVARSRTSVASDHSHFSSPVESLHTNAFNTLPKKIYVDGSKINPYEEGGKKKIFSNMKNVKNGMNIRTRSFSIGSTGKRYARPIPLIVGGPYSIRSDSSLLDQDSFDSDEFDEINLR